MQTWPACCLGARTAGCHHHPQLTWWYIASCNECPATPNILGWLFNKATQGHSPPRIMAGLPLAAAINPWREEPTRPVQITLRAQSYPPSSGWREGRPRGGLGLGGDNWKSGHPILCFLWTCGAQHKHPRFCAISRDSADPLSIVCHRVKGTNVPLL